MQDISRRECRKVVSQTASEESCPKTGRAEDLLFITDTFLIFNFYTLSHTIYLKKIKSKVKLIHSEVGR